MVKKTTKTAAKKAASKVATKKAAAPVKAVKKTATKKVAVKKAAARKVATKKTAKKAAPVSPITTIVAKVDVGFGNSLYLRGSGAGLSWDKGTLMGNAAADEWVWSSDSVKGALEFKVLINDEIWAVGDNAFVTKGDRIVIEPIF